MNEAFVTGKSVLIEFKSQKHGPRPCGMFRGRIDSWSFKYHTVRKCHIFVIEL